jgi:DNA-binding transcriptional ArsR family regulator
LAIRFRLDRAGPGAARAALSPVMEAALSLHVLVRPKHHPVQHPWVRAARALSPALKREVRDLAFLYVDALPDVLLPPAPGEVSFDDALGRLEALAPAEAAYELARPVYHYSSPAAAGPEGLRAPGTRERVVDLARRLGGPGSETAAGLIFDDPAGLQGRFARLLRRYWEEAFAEEWERLLPPLRDEAAAVEAEVADGGLWPLAASLPELRIEAEARTVVRRSPHEHTVEVDDAHPLLLVPSVHAWPHVRVNCDAPWPLAIVYPARFVSRLGRLEPAPDELVRAFRALGDPTRLRALRLLAERPRSVEELAALVRLSEAGVSKHLRALSDAGLVSSVRQGYYVLYEVERTRLDALGPGLDGFLDGGPGGGDA